MNYPKYSSAQFITRMFQTFISAFSIAMSPPARDKIPGSSAAGADRRLWQAAAELRGADANRARRSHWVTKRDEHRSSGLSDSRTLLSHRGSLYRCPAGARRDPLRSLERFSFPPAPSPGPPPYQRLQAIGELQQGAGDAAEAFLHGGREVLPHPAAGQRAVRRATGQRDAGPLGARLSHGGRRHWARAPSRRAACYIGRAPGTHLAAPPAPPPNRPAAAGAACGRPPSLREGGPAAPERAPSFPACPWAATAMVE